MVSQKTFKDKFVSWFTAGRMMIVPGMNKILAISVYREDVL